MPSESAIDLQALQALRDIDPGNDSFLRELIGMFLADTPKQLAAIESGLASGDLATLTRAAHSVKGSSGHFGALALRTLSEKIEHLGAAGKTAEISALLPDYKAEYARVQAALETLLK